MTISDSDRRINEGTSFVYSATLSDSDGDPIALTDIDSITLTLFDTGTGTIINSREGQDVKNVNQVSIHATTGLLTWTALAADNVIVSSGMAPGSLEQHIALFKVVYLTNKSLNHTVELYTRQLQKVGS